MSSCVAIIQARMNSSRLPGKVLMPLAGTSVLGFMAMRVKRAELIDKVVIATTDSPADDPLCDEAGKLGLSVFRGSEDDVLQRFNDAAGHFDADIIIRLTADCPLMDGKLIDRAITGFVSGSYDYFSNVIERSFPDGLDIEIFTRDALIQAERDCKDQWGREHVTPFMRSGSGLPGKTGTFTVGHFHADADFAHLRWTLDTAKDYEFFCALSQHEIQDRGWQDIIALMMKHPELLMWNRGITSRKTVPDTTGQPSHQGYRKSAHHLARALESIPVGSQTFSKSYLGWVVGQSPVYAESGSGAILTDIDGNDYIDYMMALLPVVLGYADPLVDAAVLRQMEKGVSLSLSGQLEAELAEKLVSLIPCAEMVRFGKNGSDATTAAVRLARAFNGREKIVVCGYHGWHDWYIGTTAKHLGVPQAVRDLSLSVPFNDAEALADLLVLHGRDIAAVVIEPTGKIVPEDGYLKEVRRLCDHYGVILIFDEVISGFRIHMGGAQAEYGVTPDLAAFGKAMANGYPLSALVGRRDIMSKMETIFFSATFGGELSAIAAALATIDKLEKTDAVRRIHKTGMTIMAGLNKALDEAGLANIISYTGEAWWPRVAFDDLPVDQPLALALMRQEFTRQNLLIASGLNFCLAHDDPHITTLSLSRARAAFAVVADAFQSSDPTSFLQGDIAYSDFEVRGHMKARI